MIPRSKRKRQEIQINTKWSILAEQAPKEDVNKAKKSTNQNKWIRRRKDYNYKMYRGIAESISLRSGFKNLI